MTQPEEPPAGEISASESAASDSFQPPAADLKPTDTGAAAAAAQLAGEHHPVESRLSLPSESNRLPHVPKPTILYLMGWTATTAVVLAVLTQLYRVQTELNTPVWAVLLLALLATVLGWFYFGALFIVWHAVRRTLWRLEPGEWLILILTNCLTSFASLVFIANVVKPIEVWLRIGGALILVQLSLVMACAALFQRQRLPWRLLFALPAGMTFLCALVLVAAEVLETIAQDHAILAAIVGVGAMLIPFPLCLGLLIAGILRDALRREKRHYLHWSGVAMTVVLVLPMTAYVFLGLVMLLMSLVQG
ncbi:MAG: hypothetical protein K8T91_15485 [Planctomycetes bacterium]|nr:hypothetical protein [Planctomycetota bacterium]